MDIVIGELYLALLLVFGWVLSEKDEICVSWRSTGGLFEWERRDYIQEAVENLWKTFLSSLLLSFYPWFNVLSSSDSGTAWVSHLSSNLCVYYLPS